ncbi:MAG: 2-phospho-L-lactate guanylyltransferase [Thermomicrobiales bacterium]
MSELIVGVVPIRSFREGKTRLASILTGDQRATLLRKTASRVVCTLAASQIVDTVLVVSPERDVLDWARGMGKRILPLQQSGEQVGLNGAIDAARTWAVDRDADALLSLFADLPLLSTHDIRALVREQAPVVLGSDRRGEGTNAMLLRLGGAGETFRFAFGTNSLERHLAEAARVGVDAQIVRAPGVGFDLDTPSDWDEYLRTEQTPGWLRDFWTMPTLHCGVASQ